MAASDLDLARDRLLGRGPAFAPIWPGVDHARDVVLTTGPRGRDLAVVRGHDALAQDLAVAFTTALGTNVFDVAHGFGGLVALAEPSDPVLTRERVRLAVITLLQREPRIARIVDVRLDDGRLGAGRTDDDEARALRVSRTMEVRVQVETIAGQTLEMRIGEVPRV